MMIVMGRSEMQSTVTGTAASAESQGTRSLRLLRDHWEQRNPRQLPILVAASLVAKPEPTKPRVQYDVAAVHKTVETVSY